MGFHPHWSCFTLRSVTKVNLLKWVSILTGVVLPFVLWPKRTFEMGFHSHWSCFTLRTVTKENLWNGFPFITGVVFPFVLWTKWTFEMGFHSNWSCFTLRSVTKDNLWNGFPSSLELFYCSFCDQPLKWVSILTGVVLLFVLWPKTTFVMGFHSHWSCFTLRSVTKYNLWNGFPFSLELCYPSFCDQSEPLKWVSILTGVVLPFVLWQKTTFEIGFHPHWSCFTASFCDQIEPLKWVSILTGVVLPFVLWPKRTKVSIPTGNPLILTMVNLWNGFPFSLELFYPSFCDQSEPFKWVSILTGVVLPSFCDQSEPLKWVSILTGVVLPFVLWPKRTFEMGFHPHWSCFTLRSVTKENLLNGFPLSLELFYSSFCDQSEPLKWVSILTGVVLPFVLWPKRTFEMGFHPHWSCFTLRSVTKDNLWNGFPFSLELFYPSFCELTFEMGFQSWTFEMGFHPHWSCFTVLLWPKRTWVSTTGVVLPFVLWPKWTFEMGFHSHWSCFTLRSVTKVNLWNGFPFSLELFYPSFCDQREPLKWVSILTGVVLLFVLWPNSDWSCFTLRSVTKVNLWNGFPFSLELFYPSFCDKRQPLKWVSILTGVVLLFVLWPKRTFEMGFHPHWSCFTLRSVTKENLLNGFPFSLELFYSSNCDQSEPLKWVSILTGVVLSFVLD